MDRISDFQIDKVHRVRIMETLLSQIKNDYNELNSLWGGIYEGRINDSNIDDLQKRIYGIKHGLQVYENLVKGHIESFLTGDILFLKDELSKKEIALRSLQYHLAANETIS